MSQKINPFPFLTATRCSGRLLKHAKFARYNLTKTMFMPDTIVFNGQEAPRVEKSFYWLYVTTKLDGSGSSGACDCRKKSGPTLGLFSTLHGVNGYRLKCCDV